MTEHGKEAYAPKSLHYVLYGCDDPAEPHRRKFLQLLDVRDDLTWQVTLECMTGYIRQHRAEERKHQSRAEAREKLKRVAELAADLAKLTGESEVLETLRIYAPASRRGPADIMGYEYLAALANRATQARNRISLGPGAHKLPADLGKPTALLLCAVMVCAAWRTQHNREPSERNRSAIEACEALWVAAGGQESPNGDLDRWVRHLRAARDTKAHARQILDAAKTAEQRQPNDPALIKDRRATAFLGARQIARDCLSYVQQERP